MLKTPQFLSCYRVASVPGNAVFLISERGGRVLKGRLYALLAPLIDGHRTVDDLVDLMHADASAAEVYYTLMRLEASGYIAEADSSLRTTGMAFWQLHGVSSGEATRRIQRQSVSVNVFGEISIEPLEEALRGLGIQVQQDGAVAVVMTDDYLREGLEAFNRTALASGRRWILAKPVGRTLWVGPIFEPGTTACWECLAHRLRHNRRLEIEVQDRSGQILIPSVPAALPATVSLGLALLTTALATWTATGSHETLLGGLLSYDTATLDAHRHVLTRRPQCPACGTPSALVQPQAGPVTLTSHSIVAHDNGYRTLSPEQTLDRYGHHVSPITGLLRELRRSSRPEDSLVPAYIAAENFAYARMSQGCHEPPIDLLAEVQKSMRSVSGGKGKTDVQARASALCEALERYSGIFQGHEVSRTSRYRDLDGPALLPSVCLLFSEQQYRARTVWNAAANPSQLVPCSMDEEAEVDWTSVWSLTRECPVYVPTAFCYYRYPLPAHHRFCYGDSNGNAAGNTREEAIVQGFLELVERDCVAVWWYNRLSRPPVSLDSVAEPYFQALVQHYRSLGRQLWVLDITSDLNIPAFVAVSAKLARPESDHVLLGFGAHFDPVVGVQRALTELNQSLAWTPILDQAAAHRDDGLATLPAWWRTATLAEHQYLVPDSKARPCSIAAYPKWRRHDFRRDIQRCVALVAEQGMEMLVLDQTRPDVGLPVVKVIVPGMRHFWRRLAPGRLYDVPVRMGWMTEPPAEQSMNPVAMPF